MNFLIISEVEHKINDQNQIGAYAPYVREMNIWARYVDQVTIVAPYSKELLNEIDFTYLHPSISFVRIPFIKFTSFSNCVVSFFQLPGIFWNIFWQMKKADHIHLRCPCSIGLAACIVQLFFPAKKKTAKYAGNWDWNSKQSFSNRLQQRILRNTFFTRNMQVMVYGTWPDRSKNIVPFFTASYSEKDAEPVKPRNLGNKEKIKLIFAGTFSYNKQPLLAIKAAESLANAGYNIELNMFGEGSEMWKAKNYINERQLQKVVKMHGSQSLAVVKECYKSSHFLIFASLSEGWPKVVSEGMFWGCVPITTRVSCVSQMLGEGERGALVNANVDSIVAAIIQYIEDPQKYYEAAVKGIEWSGQFTLEKLEAEIKKLV